LNTPNQWDGTNVVIAHHSVNLFIFAAAIVVFAWPAISKLRSRPGTYNPRLLRFAYFSLIFWILWALQYATLLAAPSNSTPSSLFVNIGLGLGVMRNALWGIAVFSLFSEPFSRNRLTVLLLVASSIVIASLAIQTTILSSELITQIDAVVAAGIFTAFAVLSVYEWRLSKIAAAPFVIHGLSQWIWRSLWLNPLANTPPLILVGFPVWRVALLFAWFRVISAFLERAEPVHRKAIEDLERLELPDPSATISVMISSTESDLAQERDAAERAIRDLRLTSFRAETIGSFPNTTREVCTSMAQRCDIFLLITGTRYGDIIEDGKSYVEFEFEVARAQNPRKILLYVKDRVNREPKLTEFLQRLPPYFRTLFITPEDLYEAIQRDIPRWMALRLKQRNRT
jgi:uncharacterized protein DUF4062